MIFKSMSDYDLRLQWYKQSFYIINDVTNPDQDVIALDN